MALKTPFIIGIIIGIILVSLLAYNLIKPDINLIKKEKSFNIPDECGIIIGNLVHPIKDEDACKMTLLDLKVEVSDEGYAESLA